MKLLYKILNNKIISVPCTNDMFFNSHHIPPCFGFVWHQNLLKNFICWPLKNSHLVYSMLSLPNKFFQNSIIKTWLNNKLSLHLSSQPLHLCLDKPLSRMIAAELKEIHSPVLKQSSTYILHLHHSVHSQKLL